MTEDKSYCTKCEKVTISKRLGRAHYHCEECDNDKSLSDMFWFEATQKTSNTTTAQNNTDLTKTPDSHAKSTAQNE